MDNVWTTREIAENARQFSAFANAMQTQSFRLQYGARASLSESLLALYQVFTTIRYRGANAGRIAGPEEFLLISPVAAAGRTFQTPIVQKLMPFGKISERWNQGAATGIACDSASWKNFSASGNIEASRARARRRVRRPALRIR